MSNATTCWLPQLTRLRSWAKVLAVDVRSLAAVRIGMGVVLLVTLAVRAGDVTAFYSDSGVLPRAARIALDQEWVGTTPPYWISLHMLSGYTWFQLGLFAAAAIAAVGVMVGYRTRLSIAISWLLLVSLQGRNPLVLHGGDNVLRCLLFWAMLLPMGAVWSLDQWLTKSKSPSHVLNCASAAVLLQLCIIYWFTGILKSDPLWRSEFTATYFALSMDHFTTALGYALLPFPTLLQMLTVGVLLLEIGGPTLLLFPIGNRVFRVIIPFAFIMFHAGLALTMRLGEFPFICMIYWLIVLPREFWKSKPTDHLVQLTTRLLSFLSSLVENSPFNAVPWRRLFGQPHPGFFQIGAATNVLVLFLLSYVVLVNGYRANGNWGLHMSPGPLRVLGDAAQLNQYWGMFAPRPYATGGWISLEGILVNGERVNLFHPELPPQTSRPAFASASYKNMQWRRFLLNMLAAYSPIQRQGLSDYLQRQWNASHSPDEQLAVVELIHRARPILPPGSHLPRPTIPITLLRKDYITNTCVMARDSGIGGS